MPDPAQAGARANARWQNTRASAKSHMYKKKDIMASSSQHTTHLTCENNNYQNIHTNQAAPPAGHL